MIDIYKKYKKLKIDKSLIGLEQPSSEDDDGWDVPVGARIIGGEGCFIYYCFIKGHGDMVFAINGESYDDHVVHPLAENFETFLSLILTANGVTAIEQITGWSEETYNEFVVSDGNKPMEEDVEEHAKVLAKLQSELKLTPHVDPYNYVKNLQSNFDYSTILMTNEYYDTIGEERPDGTQKDCNRNEEPCEVVTFKCENGTHSYNVRPNQFSVVCMASTKDNGDEKGNSKPVKVTTKEGTYTYSVDEETQSIKCDFASKDDDVFD